MLGFFVWSEADGCLLSYLNNEPAKYIGWVKNAGKDYFFDNSSKSAKSTWVNIDGKKYFDSDGQIATGVFSDGKGLYLTDSEGVSSTWTGWLSLDGKWYSLASGGAMRTGWYLDLADGSYYCLDPATGVMQTGWITDKGNLFFCSP